MKKAILFSLAALFLLGGCSQQKSKDVTILSWSTQYSDYPEVLNGKVKEIKKNCLSASLMHKLRNILNSSQILYFLLY